MDRPEKHAGRTHRELVTHVSLLMGAEKFTPKESRLTKPPNSESTN